MPETATLTTLMAPRRTSRLIALNDARLSVFLEASDENDRNDALQSILEQHVQPVAGRAVGAYSHGSFPVSPQDEDDVVSEVTLRMIRKLRGALVLEEESIQNIEAYVVTLTRNALRDLMRRRSPNRTRVRSRIRYVLCHDPRLALWNHEGVVVGGMAKSAGASPHDADVQVLEKITRTLPSAERLAADALVALFTAAGGPLRFSNILRVFNQLWNVADDIGMETRCFPAAAPDPSESRLETHQYLVLLWREIAALPRDQRRALLLNLRAPGSENATVLFVAAGVAQFDAIAEAVGMTPQRLMALWDDLPLDDLTIAAHLGVTRQQVINLRKSARERLVRRMWSHSRPYE
jgi:DNA-directed RNA polymerase specialized sigma24 family protein